MPKKYEDMTNYELEQEYKRLKKVWEKQQGHDRRVARSVTDSRMLMIQRIVKARRQK